MIRQQLLSVLACCMVFGRAGSLWCQEAPAIPGKEEAAVSPVRVDGERQLLDAVRAGLETTRLRYSVGELAGEVRFRDTSAVIRRLTWSKDGRYCDYEVRYFATEDRNGPAKNGARLVTLQNQHEILSWSPSGNWVARYPRDRATIETVVQVEPNDNWFTFQDTGIPLVRLLDPERPKGAVSAFRIVGKGHVVQVVREAESVPEFVFEFDLDLGGVPVSYYCEGRYQGKYVWKTGADGAPYLAEYSWSRNVQGGGLPDVPQFEMKITEWNPTVQPTAQQFEFSSLKLPIGTEIRTRSSSGSESVYWIGQRPNRTLQQQLKDLGQAMQRRGFAVKEQ